MHNSIEEEMGEEDEVWEGEINTVTVTEGEEGVSVCADNSIGLDAGPFPLSPRRLPSSPPALCFAPKMYPHCLDSLFFLNVNKR